MYPNSIYFGLIYRYFGAKVYTIWVHDPLGTTISSGILRFGLSDASISALKQVDLSSSSSINLDSNNPRFVWLEEHSMA